MPDPAIGPASTGHLPAERTLADHLRRRRRAALAGHRGDRDEARALLLDDDPGVRAIALGALVRLEAISPSELLAAAADPDAGVRRRAADEAARALLDDASVTAALLELLEDDDATVAETAAFALGERPAGDGPVVARLATMATDHPDALCREAAVAALGAVGDASGLPAILAATRDKATVRRRAVIALAPFDGAEVDAALARALEDRDWQVRQAAEDLTA
ncbi:HEAT repeat domain-containing protein [Rhabdothermincola salaria]|uniref:HEAT repeat domain-containing protein n=1 Tax=Rhabdothermincola salaria TaxID=2903142 RepID=UPI001E452928|nr:HEAT repeat domain-containing protein [Rhabdothermincola salaria]MCD9625610.1 HEAT repeat domain-containing protein [Rhabdothermincola salaria]